MIAFIIGVFVLWICLRYLSRSMPVVEIAPPPPVVVVARTVVIHVHIPK
jgi:hypothetical protein